MKHNHNLFAIATEINRILVSGGSVFANNPVHIRLKNALDEAKLEPTVEELIALREYYLNKHKPTSSCMNVDSQNIINNIDKKLDQIVNNFKLK